MEKFFTVFKFHLKENVTSKVFLISCTLMFLAIVGIFGYNHYKSDNTSKDKIGYINTVKEMTINQKELEKQFNNIKFKKEENEEQARKRLKDGKMDGLFIIKEKEGKIKIDYTYNGMPNQTSAIMFENYIYQKKIELETVINKLDPTVVNKVLEKPEMKYIPLQDSEKKFGIVYAFVMALYIFIIMFGQIVSNSIVTEKSTRVMEMMIPKVEPIKMMYAKIMAILTSGILQVGSMGLAALSAYLLGWINMDGISIFNVTIDFSVVTPGAVILFLIYFVLGFLLYALIFAALGSVVTRTEELQGLLTPFMLMIVGAFFMGMRAIFEPSERYIELASYFPFFTPIVTFARYMMGEANITEILLTGVILIITIVVVGIITSKIYKKGVLKYSNKTSFSEIFKMMKNK